MIPPNESLAPNTDAVVAEVIDGEAVIIDLATGVYYSMAGVGGSIWSMIEAGSSLEDIVSAVVACYDVSRERAAGEVEELVDDLVREGLVVASGREPSKQEDPVAPGGRRQPYEAPELKTYRDLGDFLALDPHLPGIRDIPWQTPGEKPIG